MMQPLRTLLLRFTGKTWAALVAAVLCGSTATVFCILFLAAEGWLELDPKESDGGVQGGTRPRFRPWPPGRVDSGRARSQPRAGLNSRRGGAVVLRAPALARPPRPCCRRPKRSQIHAQAPPLALPAFPGVAQDRIGCSSKGQMAQRGNWTRRPVAGIPFHGPL